MVHRFRDDRGKPDVQEAFPVEFFGKRGNRNNGCCFQGRIFSSVIQELNTVHAGHHNIGDNAIGLLLLCFGEPFVAVDADCDAVGAIEKQLQQIEGVVIIIDTENRRWIIHREDFP